MSVFAATEDAFHKHPALVIGSLVGVVAIGYLLTRKGGGGGTTVMQYSVGPSDASIQAGAAIQMSQIAANAATAQTVAAVNGQEVVAGLNAGVATQSIGAGVTNAQLAATVAESQQNFGYLTTLSNNATGSHLSDNQTELGIVSSNNSANVQINQADNTANTAQEGQNLNYNLSLQKLGVVNAAAGNSQWEISQAINEAARENVSILNSPTLPQGNLDAMRANIASLLAAAQSETPTSAMWQSING